MTIKKSWVAAVCFVLLYVTVAVSIDNAVSGFATIRKMQNTFYDYLQQFYAIDSRKDWRYDEFQQELNDLWFINLDTAFFDLDKERVKRRKLAELLDMLASGPEVQAIFLDFLFVPYPGSDEEDSLLLSSMNKLGDKLVLPFNVPKGVQEENEFISHKQTRELVRTKGPSGYLDYRSYLDEENMYRKVQIGNEQDTVPSAIFALIKTLRRKKSFRDLRNIPKVMEINFILRNEAAFQPESKRSVYSRAIRWTDGSTIIDNVGFPKSEKIVFIGLFDHLHGKYELPIDKFTTPVFWEMPGIYLIINSYLNISTLSYLRAASWWLIVIVNLLLVTFGVIYFQQMVGHKKNWRWEYLELAAGIIFFLLLTCYLYYFHHIKFPFVVTTFIFAANQRLYRRFRQFIFKLQ